MRDVAVFCCCFMSSFKIVGDSSTKNNLGEQWKKQQQNNFWAISAMCILCCFVLELPTPSKVNLQFYFNTHATLQIMLKWYLINSSGMDLMF